MGSNKKLDTDEEIPLESGVVIDNMDGLDDLEVDDDDELSLEEEPSGSQVLQSTSNSG